MLNAAKAIRNVLSVCPNFVELPPQGSEVTFAGAILSPPSPHLVVANLLLIFAVESVPVSVVVKNDDIIVEVNGKPPEGVDPSTIAIEVVRVARERTYQVMSEVVAGGPLIMSYATSLAPHLAPRLGLPKEHVPPVTPVTRSNKVVMFQVGVDCWMQFVVTAIIVTGCEVTHTGDAPFPFVKDWAAEIYLLQQAENLTGLATYLQARSMTAFQECPLATEISRKDVGGDLGRASIRAGSVIVLACITGLLFLLFLPSILFYLAVGILFTSIPLFLFLLLKNAKVGGTDDASHAEFARATSWPHYLEESRLEARDIVRIAQKLGEPAHRRQFIIEALDGPTAAEVLQALSNTSAA